MWVHKLRSYAIGSHKFIMSDKEKLEEYYSKRWYSSSVEDLQDGTFKVSVSTQVSTLAGSGNTNIVKWLDDNPVLVKRIAMWMH